MSNVGAEKGGLLGHIEVVDLTNMTENTYLELSETMKEIVEEKDKELRKTKKELKEIRRDLMLVYGMVDYVRDIIDKVDLEEIIKIDLGDILQTCVSKIERNI